MVLDVMGPAIVTSCGVIIVAIIGGIFTLAASRNRSDESNRVFVDMAVRLAACEERERARGT